MWIIYQPETNFVCVPGTVPNPNPLQISTLLISNISKLSMYFNHVLFSIKERPWPGFAFTERLDPSCQKYFFSWFTWEECYFLFRNHRFKNVNFSSGSTLQGMLPFVPGPQIQECYLPYVQDPHYKECYLFFQIPSEIVNCSWIHTSRMLPFVPDAESYGCYLLFLSVLLEPLQGSVLHHSLHTNRMLPCVSWRSAWASPALYSPQQSPH